MTHLTGTRVTARGQTGTVDSFMARGTLDGARTGYWILWDDGSWTLERPNAIDEVE